MPRRLIFKEGNNLSSIGPIQSGYKMVAYEGGTFSQKVGGTVSAIGGNEYQTAIVNISSAQILNMNGDPGNNIELLPAPGVNKYYQVDNIILEYNLGTLEYNTISTYFLISGGGFINQRVLTDFIKVSFSNVQIIYPSANFVDSSFVYVNTMEIINEPFTFKGDSVTGGDGTIRAIIKYKVRTFGE